MAKMLNEVKENLSFENVLIGAMKLPFVRINRTAFLSKELQVYYPEKVVNDAIRTNPANVGATKENLIHNIGFTNGARWYVKTDAAKSD